MWLFDLFFSSILQIWYVEVRISESPLDRDNESIVFVCKSIGMYMYHFKLKPDPSRKHAYIILTPWNPTFI